jgi:hypothetical protein
VVSEERIELNALFEIFYSFEAADVLKEVKVAVSVDAGSNESVPVHALQLYVCVVCLEGEVKRLAEVNVRTLDSVHVLTSHLKLVEVKVFGEDLHLNYYYDNNFNQLLLLRSICTALTVTELAGFGFFSRHLLYGRDSAFTGLF